jgi:phosphoserine phosphatase RsbU/P
MSETGTQDGPGQPGGWNLSFAAKLVIGVCALVLLTGMVITWLAQRSSRATAQTLAGSLFKEVSAHTVTHTRAFVFRAAPLAESLRQLADQGLTLDDSDRLAKQLLALFNATDGLSWISYGDEAGTFTGVYRTPEGGMRVNQSRIVDGHTRMAEHDVLPDGHWKLFRRDENSGYDPRVRPFYLKAKEKGGLVWLPPYVFYDQGVPGITCAAPVKDATGAMRGVFTVDFDLNALSEFVATLSVSENSRLFLFTADRVLLAHPDLKTIAVTGARGNGKLLTLVDARDPLVDAFNAQLRPEHLRQTERKAFHTLQFEHDKTDYLASVTTFPVGEDQMWAVGAVAPEIDFLSGVWRSQRMALLAAAIALLVAVLLAVALARRVSGPVSSLIGFMKRVGAGDLEGRADFGGSREFRQLSSALNNMIEDLRDRLRLRHSLDVAMEVQQRLLPKKPPRVEGLDIAGHSTYCDETGGDYYDFLILDEASPDHVIVALGDVMGHGVAAALVMAGTRAVLRDRATHGGSLADVMTRLNRMLSSDLEGSRFMTMHLAVMDTTSGIYRWVSAGHDPAIVYDPRTNNFEERDEGDMPLGVSSDASYEEFKLGPLQPGQIVVVGTDGIWEMPNATNEQYGKDRLRNVIRRAASGSAADIVDAIVASLVAFRGPRRPVDDVTLVVMKLPAGRVLESQNQQQLEVAAKQV